MSGVFGKGFLCGGRKIQFYSFEDETNLNSFFSIKEFDFSHTFSKLYFPICVWVGGGFFLAERDLLQKGEKG
jgi:hypothetical protein